MSYERKSSGLLAPAAINIWYLALGYFAFYIPYSALIKALSSNLLVDYGVSNSGGVITASGFLPVVLLGTVITMPLILLLLGWYRYLRWPQNEQKSTYLGSDNQLFGFNKWSVLSGIAFSVIIATTTLAYSFVGVSIVFALLLMRGGVLVMSPLVDKLFKREVHWYSWAGLAISLMAVGLALSQINEYSLSLIVLINLAGYLTGYIFRLRQMTHYAKDAQEQVNRQFMVQENTVAMICLVVIAIFTLGYHLIANSLAFSQYLSLMLSSGVFWAALVIGVFYGILGIFGTLIYLNRRENTFSIPVNRCSSLLSGVMATLLLMWLFEGQTISTIQVISALSICVALSLMSLFDAKQITTHLHSMDNPLQRVWLFVCDGNRMRSPMAAAICNKLLESHLQTIENDDRFSDVVADSAAISLGKRTDMPDVAREALGELSVDIDEHRATQLTEQQVHNAEKIYCMSEEQCQTLASQYPWAVSKLVNLGRDNEDGEIKKPAGVEKSHFTDLAHILHKNIQNLVRQLDVANEQRTGLKLEQTNA